MTIPNEVQTINYCKICNNFISNKPNDKILTIINDTELRMKSMTLFDTINEYSKNITTWLKQVCNKSSLTDKM